MTWRRKLALQLARRAQGRSVSVGDLADEGMLLVASALRLFAKNLLILRVLREGSDYDQAELLAALRRYIGDLIDEKEREITRLQKESLRAGRKIGWATRHDDYRKKDVPTLRLREAVARRLVVLLHECSDDAYLLDLLATARESALDDMLQARLLQFAPVQLDARYERDRELRMDLIRHDLSMLVDSEV